MYSFYCYFLQVFCCVRFWGKGWSKGAFIWNSPAAGKVPEGLKYTTTLRRSAEKVAITMPELSVETALTAPTLVSLS